MLPRAKGTPLVAPLLLPDGAESIATEGGGAKERVAMSRKVVLAFPLLLAALVVAVSICSPRVQSILRQSEATLGWGPVAPNKTSFASDKAFLVKREQPNVDPTPELKEQNGQNRPRELLGKKEDGFVHVQDDTAKQRRHEMRYLMEMRRDTSKCGADMKTTLWKEHPEKYPFSHEDNSVDFKNGISTLSTVKRHSCDAPHPKYHESDGLQVHTERYGPFKGTGNGDWSDFNNYDDDSNLDDESKFYMRDLCLANKDMYIRGSFAAIVKENGDFYSFPPLHMHHNHIHPYKNNTENNDKILPKRMNGTQLGHDGIGIIGGGMAYTDHHVIAQQHPDTLCSEGDEDDFSCLLHLFPPGHGMRVRGASGFRIDFQVNDLRTADTKGEGDAELHPPQLTPLEYYVDIIVFWTSKPQIPVTYLHISAPYDQDPQVATYPIPIDESSTMIYYNYTHDWRDDAHLQVGVPLDEQLAAGVMGVQGLGAGTFSNVVAHSHQGMFDSLFIFKSSNKSYDVFNAIDTMRPENHHLPYIPECHNATLEQTKDRVITLAMEVGGGELVCEVTKPGLVWAQTQFASVKDAGDNGTERTAKSASYAYYDRAMDFNCLKETRLEPGDTLTFVAFSKSRPTSTSGHTKRGTFAASQANVFEQEYLMSEHCLFRMDFISDKAQTMAMNDDAKNATAPDDIYAPPSVMISQRWVNYASDEDCFHSQFGKSWFDFINKNISGWNYDPKCEVKERLSRKKSMLDQCPASISMEFEKPKKDKIDIGKKIEGEDFSSE